ncbi:hypothetical protein BDZ94DRAFT_1327200, partial [Collybia nuda]
MFKLLICCAFVLFSTEISMNIKLANRVSFNKSYTPTSYLNNSILNVFQDTPYIHGNTYFLLCYSDMGIDNGHSGANTNHICAHYYCGNAYDPIDPIGITTTNLCILCSCENAYGLQDPFGMITNDPQVYYPCGNNSYELY